jgi:hypothetical protein
MRGAGDEPFAPVNDVIVRCTNHRGRDIGGVRGGHVGFGHPERRTGFGFQKRLEPARLLFRLGAVLQRDHVGNVGRLTVENFRRPEQPPHDLGERRILEVRKPRARLVAGKFGKAEIPQSRGAGFLLQLAHEGSCFALDRDMLDPGAVARQHLLVEKRLQPFSPRFGRGRKIEIHIASLRRDI